jgi:hypothetical protein
MKVSPMGFKNIFFDFLLAAYRRTALEQTGGFPQRIELRRGHGGSLNMGQARD